MKLIEIKTYLNRKVDQFYSLINNDLTKPSSIHLCVTHNCCLSCKHCDIWKIKDEGKELTTEQLKDAIFRLKKWLGSFNLNISGGEPFLRDDLIDVIKFSQKIGVAITVTTNGVLINKEMAERIAKSGIKNLNISLDGFEERHDYIRNKKGVYDKAIKAINYFKDFNIPIYLATVITKHNLEELSNIVGWAKTNNLDGINFQPLMQNFGAEYDANWHSKSEFWPEDEEKIENSINKIIELKKKGMLIINSIKQLELMKVYFKNPCEHASLRCIVGEKNFSINEYGDVMLCFFKKPIGNIMKEYPKNIWDSEEAKIRREQIDLCKRNCDLLNCNFT